MAKPQAQRDGLAEAGKVFLRPDSWATPPRIIQQLLSWRLRTSFRSWLLLSWCKALGLRMLTPVFGQLLEADARNGNDNHMEARECPESRTAPATEQNGGWQSDDSCKGDEHHEA